MIYVAVVVVNVTFYFIELLTNLIEKSLGCFGIKHILVEVHNVIYKW